MIGNMMYHPENMNGASHASLLSRLQSSQDFLEDEADVRGISRSAIMHSKEL